MVVVEVAIRVIIKSPGPGIFPGYYECGPRLLLLENRRKIEPNKIPSCLISPPTCCVYPATWNLRDNPEQYQAKTFENHRMQ